MTEMTAQMTGYISRNPTLIKAYGAGYLLTTLPLLTHDLAARLEVEPLGLAWFSVIGYLLVACCFGYGIRTVRTQFSRVALSVCMACSLISIYGAMRPLVTGWVMLPSFVAMICIGVGLGVSGFRRSRAVTEPRI